MRACDQLFVRRNIGAEIARIQERRRADTDMDFGRAGFAKHRDQVGNRCSTDNGVVDEHDPFSFYNRFENAQLDFDAGFPFLLGRLDEGTADIAVFVERKTERDAGFFGIALCGGKSGVRDTTDEVCVNRVGLCESCTAADSGLVDTDIVYFAVEAGKINIFKNTMRFFYVNRHKFGFQISGFVKRYNFSRSDIADEFGADRSEGAAFRGENPGVVPLSDAERF